jgi:hypothetical protein
VVKDGKHPGQVRDFAQNVVLFVQLVQRGENINAPYAKNTHLKGPDHRTTNGFKRKRMCPLKMISIRNQMLYVKQKTMCKCGGQNPLKKTMLAIYNHLFQYFIVSVLILLKFKFDKFTG